ncbi:MAG: acetate/propionate family kinase [Methylococcaceae bacterium]|nr:acetate/propionate family kinase [Methylococcaceae bacterium]
MFNYLLVINAGSSSIKFTLFRIESSGRLVEELKGQVDGIGNFPQLKVIHSDGGLLVDKRIDTSVAPDHKNCLNEICSWLLQYIGKGKLQAIGHRVVHGGLDYITPVLINQKILSDLENLIPLAPLHQPHNLLPIRTFEEIIPGVPQIVCFDTAFHRTQSETAQSFGLPKRFFNEGIRRYGFHGISYEFIASELPRLGLEIHGTRIIVAHLGSGASLCAIQNGVSIATTMGFSPLDGLVMGTRCGSLDPGVMLYLMDRYKMNVRELEHLLYYESGLLGISGVSNDMRTLLASESPLAAEAIKLFVYRIGREIGSLAAALGGLDALIFTGGIGENSAEIRDLVCKQVSWLGLELDRDANRAAAERLSTIQSKISAWVVKTDENLMIAKHTQNYLGMSHQL